MLDPKVLGGLPVFAEMSTAARRVLAARAVERHFAPGEVLFHAGAEARGLFVVLEGRVRVVRAGADRRHVVHVEGPGGSLGEVPLFAGGGYPATAIAAEPARCVVVGRDGVRAALAADPDVAWVFLRRLAERVRGLVDRLDRLAARSVSARLATWLLDRREAAGVRGSAPFALGLTQSELAEELGTVREVVVRSLRELRSEDILLPAGRGRVRIVADEALRERAGG